jgi:hypothetical protein
MIARETRRGEARRAGIDIPRDPKLFPFLLAFSF